MRKIIQWIIPFFTTLYISMSQAMSSLQVGDVILLPLRCHVCREIEAATGSIYSHSGIVIQVTPTILIAQSLNTVHTTSLPKFLAIKDPQRPILIRRSYENRDDHFSQKKFMAIFQQNFQGLPFDHHYQWNNYAPNGKEQLYCSEFITKFLNNFLHNPIVPTPMDYSTHYYFWRRYFNAEPPQGELGTSPSTFETSPLFFTVKN